MLTVNLHTTELYTAIMLRFDLGETLKVTRISLPLSK